MTTTKRLSLTATALWALALSSPGPILAKAPDRFAQAVEAILKREVFEPALVAIDIRDLETGRLLFERSAAKNLRPASTMKLFTTAAILDALGPGGALPPTTVETAARLDSEGRILGDIYLIGRGEPNLSGRFPWRSEKSPFDQLAKDLRDSGITRVDGRLVGHDGFFTDEPVPDGWTADDLVWSYGAEVSALSAFDNSLHLRLEPSDREGDPTRLVLEPATDFIQVENHTVTAAEGVKAKVSLRRALGSRQVLIEGSLPRLGEPWTGSVAAPEPTLFATTLLAEALARQGVKIGGAVVASRDALPGALRPLASVRGPGVAEQIRVVNKESQNLHAEMLLRRLGLSVFKDASIESSLRARESFLRGIGVRVEATAMLDGSGLSRSGLSSARSEVDLLVAMSKHPLAAAFKQSLPIAGVDGSLKRRMNGTKAEGRVFAKTGSLRHVNALAGYVDAISGRRLAFSIIVNHHTRPAKEVTAAMDEICVLLADLK